MAQVAMIAGLGMMCLSSSVGSALMMGGGEEDDGAGGAGGLGPSAPDPDRACPRTVTVVRTDNPVNWGMDLQFKCGDETIAVGNDLSGTATKTVGPYTVSKTACPEVINKTNWLGGHTHPDTFDVTVSECLDAGETCPRTVTAKRLDASGGWGMNLRFQCDDEEVTIGPGGANEVTSPTPVNINKLSCPGEVNKTNWLGTDTYPDRFKITVSDCQ